MVEMKRRAKWYSNDYNEIFKTGWLMKNQRCSAKKYLLEDNKLVIISTTTRSEALCYALCIHKSILNILTIRCILETLTALMWFFLKNWIKLIHYETDNNWIVQISIQVKMFTTWVTEGVVFNE